MIRRGSKHKLLTKLCRKQTGQKENMTDRSTENLFDKAQSLEFVCLVRELAPPGFLSSSTSFPFEYAHVEKQHESYDGINIRLRYELCRYAMV